MPEEYTVGAGESVLSIAAARGLPWKKVWNDGSNSALKQKREDPDILMAFDKLSLPDLEIKEESRATEAQHRFEKKADRAKCVIVLRRVSTKKGFVENATADLWNYQDSDPAPPEDEAAANVPYHFYADGVLVAQGSTDGSGKLTVKLSPTAQDGRLILNRGTKQETVMDLGFREMDPLKEVPGVCKRLYNLGFPCPTDATEVTVEVQMAIQAFQQKYKLTVNGKADDATRNKLKEVYGG
ncbi:MAG: peptidoglycan-binding domain-containing protein [Phycisphaerae bacterium]